MTDRGPADQSFHRAENAARLQIHDCLRGECRCAARATQRGGQSAKIMKNAERQSLSPPKLTKSLPP
jgi:hypothetical protein